MLENKYVQPLLMSLTICAGEIGVYPVMFLPSSAIRPGVMYNSFSSFLSRLKLSAMSWG